MIPLMVCPSACNIRAYNPYRYPEAIMEGDETAENTDRPVGDQIPILTEGNGQVFWGPTGEPRHGDR